MDIESLLPDPAVFDLQGCVAAAPIIDLTWDDGFTLQLGANAGVMVTDTPILAYAGDPGSPIQSLAAAPLADFTGLAVTITV